MLITTTMLVASMAALPAPQAPVTSIDVDATAIAVVRGDYGTGQERRDRLGADYDAVQARVNQILAGYTVDYVDAASEPTETVPAPTESVTVTPQSYTVDDIYNLAMSIPQCAYEDGSDTDMCYWHDSNTGNAAPSIDIIYMPDGYGYQVTDDTSVSVFQRNTWGE